MSSTNDQPAAAPVAPKKKPIFTRWWFWAIIVIIVVIAIAVPKGNNSPGTVTTNPPATTSTDGGAPATSAPETTAQSNTPHFGDTYTWPSGVAVTISAPQSFTPSAYAAGPVDGYTNLKFTVTMVNNSTQSVSASLFTATVLSGGKEGPAIFDTQQNIGMVSSDVPVGKSIQFDIAFSVADANDITMSVSPDAGIFNDKVTFTN